MLHLAFNRLLQVFPEPLLEQGMFIVKHEGVMSVRLSEGLLHARVKGVTGGLHDVYIDLKKWPQVSSRCACATKSNCEHAAASLLFLRIKEKKAEGAPTPNSTLDAWMEKKTKHLAIKKKEETHCLFYDLKFEEKRIVVQFSISKKLKSAKQGKKIKVHAQDLREEFYSADDQPLLKQLKKDLLRTTDQEEYFEITKNELLVQILQTERAENAQTGELLYFGEPRSGTIEWYLESDGTQTWRWNTKEPFVQVTFLDEMIYFDDVKNEVGVLECPYNISALKFLYNYTQVQPQEVDEVCRILTEYDEQCALPFSLNHVVEIDDQPSPVFLFDAFNDKRIVELHFDYGNLMVSVFSNQLAVYQVQNNICLKQSRATALEESVWSNFSSVLEQYHYVLSPESSGGWALQGEDPHQFIETVLVPWIESQGGRAQFEHPVFSKVIDEAQFDWYSEFLENDEGYFSYELGMMIDGERINLVPVLVRLLKQYQWSDWEHFDDEHPFKIPVAEGKVIILSAARLRPLIFFLLYDKVDKTEQEQLKIKQYQWGVLQEAMRAFKVSTSRWISHEQLIEKLYVLIEQSNLPKTTIPKTCNLTLRDYQQYGVDWLQALRASGFGGILADDMGLGKTVQTLVHLMVEKEAGRLKQPALIAAPLSLIGNWISEASRFTPHLKLYAYHGSKRAHELFSEVDVVLTTYGMIQRDKDVFTKIQFSHLVLDEAQWIKNAKAKITFIIQQIQAQYRLCLSGTPFENHLGELWSLFHFLIPGLLGNHRQFKTFFQEPIEKEGDLKKKEMLIKRIQPFLLRRRKSQVAAELPKKTEMILAVTLLGAQQQIAQVRSLQTGRYQVISNNDGLSAIVDEQGNITQALPAMQPGLLIGKIHPATGLTPWSKIGDKPIILLIFTLGVVLGLFKLYATRSRPKPR